MGVYMAGLMFLLFTLGMGGPMGQADEVIITVPPARVFELSSNRTFAELKPGSSVFKVEQNSPLITTTQKKSIGATAIVVIALALLMFGENGGD